MATDAGCKEVLPKGGDAGTTRYYCEREAEFVCAENNDDPRCLEHSHPRTCCERLYWPDDTTPAEQEGVSGPA